MVFRHYHDVPLAICESICVCLVEQCVVWGMARGKHSPAYADSLVVTAPRVQLSREILRFIK